MLRTSVHHRVYRRAEVGIKGFHHGLPLFFSFGNAVEIFFNMRRKVIVHDGGETVHQEVVHHDAYVGRQQFALVAANVLLLILSRYHDAFKRIYQVLAFFALAVAPGYVLAMLDGADGWGVGRRATDAQFLHLMHKTGLGITCRTLCKAFNRGYFAAF